MPVTVHPASHPARRWTAKPAASERDLLESSCRNEDNKCKRILQSSFVASSAEHISSSPNGLVWAAYHAYSGHHHLTLRPEDVWFAVLTKLSFYINAHAERLRSLFVAHEGQKELVVTDSGTIEVFNPGKMAVEMRREMDKNLVDRDLRRWIMPSFTTATNTDIVTASVLMMGTLQKYWVDLRGRLDKLRDFGSESERFGRFPIPVLDHFIGSFDRPEDPQIIDFWSKIADRYGGGSGPTYLRGWITAFCFWDAKGSLLCGESQGDAGCNISGTVYYRVDMSKIPAGYAGVPVTVIDNESEVHTRMVAGSIAIAASSSGGMLDTSIRHRTEYRSRFNPPETHDFTPEIGPETGLDSLRPVTGWWMYEKTG